MIKVESTVLEQLEQIQQMAIEHAVEEMHAAHALGLDTKADRGDRMWLSKMCAQSLGVVLTIERYLELKKSSYESHNPEVEEEAQDAFVKRAQAHLDKIIKSNKPRFKPEQSAQIGSKKAQIGSKKAPRRPKTGHG